MIVKRLYVYRAPVNVTLVADGKRDWIEQNFIPSGMRDLQKNAQQCGWKVLEVGEVAISMRSLEAPDAAKQKSKAALKKEKKRKTNKTVSGMCEIIGQFDVTLDMPNEQVFHVVPAG